MARLAMVLLCVAGCDRLFGLAHVSDRPDARDDGSGAAARDDAGSGDDASSSCPDTYDIALAAFPDSRYFYQPITGPWLSAQQLCVQDAQGAGVNTHLVVIQDENERTALYGALLAKTVMVTFWIGLSDRTLEDSFLWVTGEPLGMPPRTTPPWPPNQPDNENDAQDCVRMKAPNETTYGGYFDDIGCTSVLAYVCECDAYPSEPANY